MIVSMAWTRRAGPLLALALCFAPGARGADERREPPPALRKVKTIVTLGDSITQAGGQPGGYVWLLQRYLDALYPERAINIVNAGISGHKSTDMQARFQRDVIDVHPDLVTISVGVNDVWHAFYDFANHQPIPRGNGQNGVPLAIFRQKVKTMVRDAQKAHIKVVLLSATVVYEDPGNRENHRISEYNQTMKEIAQEESCLFIDLFHPFTEVLKSYQRYAGTGTNLLTTDGVHMNAAGNQLMAYTILRMLGVAEKDLDSAKSAIQVPKS